MPKDFQLRVRLPEDIHNRLQQSADENGVTVSDVVREAIDAFLGSSDQPRKAAVVVSIDNDIFEMALEMARILDRRPKIVIEECVSAVLDSHQCQRTPLIVLELNLRQKYFKEVSESNSKF